MVEFLKPITKQITQTILEQMSYSICQIQNGNDELGIGYFCYIKYENFKIPVVIINNYLIDENYNFTFNVKMNDIETTLKIGETRYKNEEYNISILEIKRNNKFKINFIEFDDKIYESDSEMYYYKKGVYTLQFKNINDILVSYGKINNSHQSQLTYSGLINHNSKFPFIFNLSNNKLIGFHLRKYYNFNKGIFFNKIIEQFIELNKYNQNNYNEIELIIKVEEKDINKRISILNSDEGNISLKPLTEKNTELYINDKKYKYNKCFNPEEEGIYRIKLKFFINLTNCSYMFARCKKTIFINFISINTKYVTNMEYMFYKCQNLKTVNLLCFDTQNIIKMRAMFAFCYNLYNLDLSNFNFKNVLDMYYFFYECNSLKNVNSFKNIINISIDVDSNSVGKKLFFLNKKPYDKYNHYNTNQMNESNAELYINKTKLKYNNYFTPIKKGMYNIILEFNCNITDCHNMFYDCENIIDINFISFNTNNVSNMSHMFYGCKNLKYLNLSSFNTNNVSNMSHMFYDCNNFTNLNLSSFTTINAKDMNFMFCGCRNLNHLDISSFNTKNVKSMEGMFSNCNNLNDLNLSNFDTTNIENMGSMFYDCQKLKILDLSSFNTKKVKYMTSMFNNCFNLTNINLSSFDTKNVRDMSSMFYSCVSLEDLNLSSLSKKYIRYDKSMNSSFFNTENVTNMNSMFSYCNNLCNINLSSFNTTKVKDMGAMFSYCGNLKSLDLSSFNTETVTDMSYMFYNCKNLSNLKISSFKIQRVTKVNGFFFGCNKCLLYNNWTTFEQFDKEILLEENNILDTAFRIDY